MNIINISCFLDKFYIFLKMNNFFECDNKPALKFKFNIADASFIILSNKSN
jgi:hypothetical protein